jgi:glycine dehydrogenase subunit 2
MSELIFEKNTRNDGGHIAEPRAGAARHFPKAYLRTSPTGIPNASELDVVRHFTHLSRKNFSVDTHFYPLGSCTMKYNPKVFDQISAWPFFARIHPYQDDAHVQGMLEVFHGTERALCEITGMDAFTLQPAAGAHGELTGLLIVRAHHAARGRGRDQVLVPDSAHGTNPASAALAGYEVVQVRTDAGGRVDLADLAAKLGPRAACFMITNPNTLGLFERDILEITRLVHAAGALVYYDGANLNALLGIARPGDMGFDIVHVNLHKTFAVPHGSGGPGSGPVGVKRRLEKFLPVPRLTKGKKGFAWDHDRPHAIGRMRSFYGNAGAVLRAYCYIRALGAEGLAAVSENAILAANYLKARLGALYEVPYGGPCMHEFILTARRQREKGARALDVAKRLLDFGIHAPTIYFPLTVEEAMMIEPTETESKETLDRFVDVMARIAREAEENPQVLLDAPVTTPVRRIDEVRAARQPDLRWR